MSLRDCQDVSGLTLSDAELMEILGLKKSEYYRRRKRGLYERFEVERAVGSRRQYSGTLVQRWRDGAGKAPSRGAGTTQGASLRRVVLARVG